MGIFSSIKDAIFGKKAVAPAPAAAPVEAATAVVVPDPSIGEVDVDVEAILSAQAARAGQPLNWRTSIVDLMKLIGIDPSLANRKELAQELGYTGELSGSAEMNIWLHREVMRALAANGGKVPADLTD